MDSSTDNPSAAVPSERRRPILMAMTSLVLGLFVLWVIGQCLSDLTWYTALCFYIPSPFVGVVLLCQMMWLARRRRRRAAAILLVLALAPLGCVAFVENQWVAPNSPAVPKGLPRLRLVHWNTWYARRGWEPILERLKSFEADVYILSEAPRGFDVDAVIKSLGPDFTVRRFEDMAVFARGETVVHERLAIGRHGWSRLIDWESPAGPIRILAADFPSHPRTHRVPLVNELRREMEQLKPDIVVGDLNAPRRSPGLRSLPDGYRHAYLTSGSGWSYTWPVVCPMWAIDQCIAGRRVFPLHYELQSTTSSDHRLQLCDFALDSAVPPDSN